MELFLNKWVQVDGEQTRKFPLFLAVQIVPFVPACVFSCVCFFFFTKKAPPVLSLVADLDANLPLCPAIGRVQALLYSGENCPEVISPEADGVGRRVFSLPVPPSLRTILSEVSNSHFKRQWGKAPSLE